MDRDLPLSMGYEAINFEESNGTTSVSWNAKNIKT
jgi:hypothetical protein